MKETIEEMIKRLKSFHRRASEQLTAQLNWARNEQWKPGELEDYIKGERDVADEHSKPGEPIHDDIREIQDEIINEYKGQ